MDEKECYFEKDDAETLDYKNVELLKQFMTPHAKILSREDTGLCARHQRTLARAIKRARFMGLLPYKST